MKVPALFSGKKCENLFFHKNFSAISSSGHLNCGFHKPAAESLSPRNRKWFKENIPKRWVEFKKYFWTCWMQIWEPFQKIFTKRRRLFGSDSENRIELYWFQKNHFSSNVPLDSEVTLFRTMPFFLHNAEKCYLKIRGKFLYCFLSNRLFSSRFLLDSWYAFLRVLLISFSQKAEIQWQKNFHQMWYCPSYGFSRQVEGSFDKPKAQNVLAKGPEIVWKKNKFLQNSISLRKVSLIRR